MATYSDEHLLRRARDGGKSLTALAILAGLVFLVAVGVSIAMNFSSAMNAWAAITGCIALGYGLLARAAFRGNPAALTAPLVLAALQLLASGAALLLGSNQGEPPSAQCGVVGMLLICVVIVSSLGKSRAQLIELRRRGLWDAAFAPARPSTHLCAAGAILLVGGVLAFFSSVYAGAYRTRAAHAQNVAFLQLVNQKEPPVIEALKAAAGGEHGRWETVRQLYAELEDSARAIARREREGSPLAQVVSTYLEGLQKWREGFTILEQGGAEALDTARPLLAEGDALRRRAMDKFNGLVRADKLPAGAAQKSGN